MEQIVYRLGEICKLYAGGDAPKEVSETKTDEYHFQSFLMALKMKVSMVLAKKPQ